MSYYCPKCAKPLSVSDVEGYPFVCHHCDENFYQFEATWVEEEPSETGYTCPKCGNTESFHADYVVATFWGCYIDPDGWDYSGSGGELEFDESTNLRCTKCGYEANHSEFEEE